jgi:hypothetical protein
VHAQQSARDQGSASTSNQAAAGDKRDKRDKPARKSKRSRAERKRARAAAADVDTSDINAPKAEQAVPAPAAAAAATADAKPQAESAADKDAASRPAQAESELDAANVHKEGDTEVKVMEFSGLDIEGQLKTPQMLYFLNRLRAEFGRPRLPHRSFMPELQAGTQDKAMR